MEWISVDERLPGPITTSRFWFPCIGNVQYEDGRVDVCQVGMDERGLWCWPSGISIKGKTNVTHWQPLPEPAQQEVKG